MDYWILYHLYIILCSAYPALIVISSNQNEFLVTFDLLPSVKENNQWQLLGERKLWGAATNSDLTIYLLCHLGVEVQFRRFTARYTALKHLVVYLWSVPHAVAAENISGKETIIISFPHMTLLKSTILRQPLFIQTGALMGPIRNSGVQMARVGRIKYKYH